MKKIFLILLLFTLASTDLKRYEKAVVNVLKTHGEYKFTTSDGNKISIIKDVAVKMGKNVRIEIRKLSNGDILQVIYVK